MTDLWRAGLLDVDGLVDAVVPLDEIGDVAARQARGEIVRAVLVP
jgi:S-(hydroxymethyl)glutathione dehydrogenase/alcohol dehydrogenase